MMCLPFKCTRTCSYVTSCHCRMKCMMLFSSSSSSFTYICVKYNVAVYKLFSSCLVFQKKSMYTQYFYYCVFLFLFLFLFTIPHMNYMINTIQYYIFPSGVVYQFNTSHLCVLYKITFCSSFLFYFSFVVRMFCWVKRLTNGKKDTHNI